MLIIEVIYLYSVEDESVKKGVLQRSLSVETSQQRMRPRSASLFSPERARSGEASSTPKRKSLRGLSRSRPSSARLGRSRSRADSFNVEEANTDKVDSIMANIKAQLVRHLAQLTVP